MPKSGANTLLYNPFKFLLILLKEGFGFAIFMPLLCVGAFTGLVVLEPFFFLYFFFIHIYIYIKYFFYTLLFSPLIST